MGIFEINVVDFAMFQMTSSAKRWWKDYVFTRPVGSPALTWEQFSQLFLEKFFPITMREDYHKQFERLQQESLWWLSDPFGVSFSFNSHEQDGCYECGNIGHIRRHCPRLLSNRYQQDFCAIIQALVAPPPARPARGRGQTVRGCHGPYAPYPRQPAFSAHLALISPPPLQNHYGGYPTRSGSASASVATTAGWAPVAPPPARPARGRGQTIRGRGDILPGHFIQHFRLLTVLQGAMDLMFLTLCSQHSVHIQLLSVHHHFRVTTARRMVEKGCLAYLAYIRDPSADFPSMDSVPVVHEFLEVLSPNLPGMPPDRDIDFCIYLAPGTQSISIHPYRMASLNLKEFKEQLQDLLDQGFIRPNVLLWGAPVLFEKKKDGSE
uniref:Uncharacterized protein LOC104215184 n=1 Tax=Nicotiana sylvestris TaxID=4096 RepID=A0A1U7VE82_NICSY